MVELRDVGYAVGARPLLEGITARCPPGSLTVVLGPNGAGKSTLLRVAAGLLRPVRGEVRYGARPLADIPLRELARLRGVLSQHAEPAFPLSAEEVVEMGRYPWFTHAPERRDREAVERALARVGMTERRAQRFSTLSTGERQKVQMARVLAQMDDARAGEGRVLFLDEPTAGLDIRHQLQLLEIAREQQARGVTLLAVLHDLDLASACADHFLLLDRGRLAWAGSRAEGLPEALVERVYQVRARRVTDPEDGRVSWRFGL